MSSELGAGSARSLSFGSVAEDYERYRPGYPQELVSLVVSAAEGAVDRAIEVGAGTGKATRVFARAGLSVTAVEPDGAMLAVLERECVGMPVTGVRAAFEDVDPAEVGLFDLLYAAASWHWTDPAQRWSRAAALVRPGGAVAFFGGPFEISDRQVAAVLARAESRYLPHGHDIEPPSDEPGMLAWPGDELLADSRFDDVRQQTIAQHLELERDSYLGYLNTVSAYRILPAADRTTLLRDVRDVLPDAVPITADVIVHTARRVAG